MRERPPIRLKHPFIKPAISSATRSYSLNCVSITLLSFDRSSFCLTIHAYQGINESFYKFDVLQISGEIVFGDPPEIHDCRGGVLADEPVSKTRRSQFVEGPDQLILNSSCLPQGLGKTVTILSLIMRTKGMVPEAPLNCEPRFIEDGEGNALGYYMIPKSELFPSTCRDTYLQGTPTRQICRRTLRSDSAASQREVEKTWKSI